MPDSIFVHIIGKTSRAVINTGSAFLSIKIIARKINDATGVALTMLIRGDMSVLTNEQLELSTAVKIPVTKAAIIPSNILPSVLSVINQKSAPFIS